MKSIIAGILAATSFFILGSYCEADSKDVSQKVSLQESTSIADGGGKPDAVTSKPPAGRPIRFQEFTAPGNQKIVKDTKTGLVWQGQYKTDISWQDSVDYCNTLKYGGSSNWHLPTIDELKSLVNNMRKDPASDFPGMPSYWFWTSSSYYPDSDLAYFVNFIGNGLVGTYDKGNDYYVRCVRPGP